MPASHRRRKFNQLVRCKAQIPLGSSSHVSTRHVRRVEPAVELVMSSVSSRDVRQNRHGQNAWARHVQRVASCRDV